MPTDEFESYFNNSLTRELARDTAEGRSRKFDELQAGHADAIKNLQAGILEKKQQEVLDAKSWVGQLGLNPDGAAGTAVNAAANLYSGASTLVGHTAGFLAGDLEAMINMGGLSEPEITAINNYKRGSATPAEIEMINARQAIQSKDGPIYTDAGTPLERFDRATVARERSSDINSSFDRTGVIHTGRKDALSAELKKTFTPNWEQIQAGADAVSDGNVLSGSAEVAKGIAKLVYNTAAAAGDNKIAAMEYMAQNLPQLAIGGIGAGVGKGLLALTNVAYASEQYQSALSDYQRANGGALPSDERRIEMAGWAASLALAEHVADLGQLRAAKGAAEAFTKTAKAGILPATKNVIVAAAKGVGEESVTEGFQTFGENVVDGKDTSAFDVYEGAVIGGLSGGGLTGGGRAVGEALKATPEHAQTRLLQQTRAKAQADAIKTGDVSGLLDKEQNTYNPVNAIHALAGNSVSPDATPELKQTNLEKASKIIADLEAERDAVHADHKLTTPEGRADYQAKLDAAKAAGNQDMVELIQGELDGADLKREKPLRLELSKLDRRLEQANEAMAQFNEGLSIEENKDVDVPTQIEAINAPVDETDTAAVQTRAATTERLIKLSMAAPDSLAPAQAVALANNKANGLTAPQRSYLRAFSAARIAENELQSVSSVSQTILTGDKKNLGLVQYRERIAAALAAGNKKQAEKTLSMLGNFEESHRGKAAAMDAAIEEFEETGKPVQYLKNEHTKAWERNDGRLLGPAAVTENGGFTVHVKTPDSFKTAPKPESVAITAALKELTAAFEIKFPATPTPTPTSTPAPVLKEEKNVQVVPQASGEVANQPAANPQVQVATPPASPAAGPTPAVIDPGSATTGNGVEAPGVVSAKTPKDMTDVELNDALDEEMGRPGYQKRDRFKELDAEMIRREDASDDSEERGLNEPPPWEGEDALAPVPQPTSAKSESTSVDPSSTSTSKASTDALVTAELKATEQTKGELQSTNTTQEETAEVVTSPESAEQTPEETHETAGKLSQLDNKSPENAPFHLKELLAEYFTQTAGRDTDTTLRPLVAVKDFATSLGEGLVKVTDYLVEKTLSEKQIAVVNAFFNQADRWHAAIKDSLPKRKRAEYRHEDMMQFLLSDGADGKTDVDENVKTALAYAVYSWAADNAKNPRYLDKKAINAILGRDKDAWVSRDAWETLGEAGVIQATMIDSLGGKVMDMLGIRLKDDGPQSLGAKLRVALGTHALKLAEDRGLVRRTTVSGEQLKALREEGQEYVKETKSNEYVKSYFFAVARDEDGRVIEAVEDIYEASRETKGVLDKLFGVTSRNVLPSLEPIKKVQKTTSGTNQGVPGEMAKILKIKQSRERKVRTDTFGLLLNNFSEEDALTMFGVVEEENETTHVVNRISVKAKNDGLRREWALFTEYVGEHLATAPDKLDTPFYLPFDVWKQQRVGIESTVVNPQTSKIVRYLVGSPSWTVTIDPANSELMDSFYLRVGEGLGVKTERADNEVSIEEIWNALKDPVYVAAVDALVKGVVRKEELSSDEQASVKAAVLKGGEKMHSLDVLIGLAYEQAAEGKPFTVQMMGEVDGVANGTMLNHVLLGAANNTFLNQGGFFEVGSDYTQYNQYRGTPGNLDIYERVAGYIYGALGERFTRADDKAAMASIWYIAGAIFVDGVATKDGRNLVKNALNPLGFGSSLKSIVNGMSNAFLAAVYAKFEKLAKDADTTQADVDKLVGHLNNLIEDPKLRFPTGLTLQEYMELRPKTGTETALKEAFAGSVGKTTSKVIKDEFADFIEKRNSLNRTAQAAWSLSDAVMRGEREAYIEELLAKGEIPLAVNGDRAGDLSKKQEAELARRIKAIVPIVGTTMSGTDSSTGLRVGKTTRKQSPDPAYTNHTQFGTPRRGGDKSANVRAITTQNDTPSVATGSAVTHSTDSGIILRVEHKFDILGVHDAAGAGVDGLRDVAHAMNQATWETLLTYSPLDEVYTSLANVLGGISTMLKDGKLSPQSVKHLQEVIQESAEKVEVAPEVYLDVLLAEAKQMAYQANITKLENMSQWASVDQYAYQGGNYKVTEENRAEAGKLLAAQTSRLPDGDRAVLDILKDVMSLSPEFKTTRVHEGDPVTQEVQEAQAGESDIDITDYESAMSEPDDMNFDFLEEPPPWEGEDELNEKTSPFGKLGTPKKINETLNAFFSGKGNDLQSASAVLSKLASMTGSGKPYHRTLIKLLRKAMPGDIRVQLITPDTKLTEDNKPPAGENLGWYYQGAIYIKSAEFEQSGLQGTETLLHELVHAALLEIIEAELDKRDGMLDAETGERDGTGDPEYTSEVLELVDRLEALRTEAINFTKQNGTYEQHAHALVNVHELIAYGTTNRAFQHMLSQIAVPARSSKNSLINGFKDFVANLVGILYGAKTDKAQQQQAESALFALIEDVTGLFNAATQEQGNAKTELKPRPINLSMAAALQTYNTLDIHAALNAGNVSRGFDEHLQGLLGGIVHKLHGPFGSFKAALMKDQAISPMDVWLKALATGEAPFASSMQGPPIPASERETHAMEQVEATVRGALERDEVSAKSAYRGLEQLYREMEETLKGKLPAAQYHFLFKLTPGGDSKSDHLARFAAYGLAHEGINKLLQVNTKIREARANKTAAEKLRTIFEKILDFFHGQITHTFGGQKADLKLNVLVGTLVDIEAKKRVTLLRRGQGLNPFDTIDKAAKKVIAAGSEKISDAANSNFIQNNRFVAVRAAGALTSVVAKGQVEEFMNTMSDFRNQHWDGRLGFIAGSMNYALSASNIFEALLRANKRREGQRKDIITNRSKMALSAFANGGKNLTDAHNKGITNVFLRTGLHKLQGHLNLKEIEHLLGNSAALTTEIDKLEAQLNGFGRLKDFFLHKANTLGKYVATNETVDTAMLMNAHNIARLVGTAHMDKITEAKAKQAEVVIEKLIALYGLKYTSSEDAIAARSVLKTENGRTDGKGNGVAFVLALHSRLEQESLDRLFHGNKALMMHGYTPEIYNPHVEVKTVNGTEGAKLVELGYRKVGPVELDPADPDQESKSMYVLKDGGLSPLVTGAIANTGLTAKGGHSKAHSGYMNVNTADGALNAAKQAHIMHAKNTGWPSGPPPDLTNVSGSNMVPVINESGHIVTWRYLMKAKTKDDVLMRDNRFNKILGAFAGSIYDKETTGEMNAKVIKALKEQYDADKAKNPAGYKLIGPKATDAESREIWSMLPDAAKAEARRVWGKDGMYVHHNMRDIVFGYRKLSLADAVRNTYDRRERIAQGLALPKENYEALTQRVLAGIFTEVVEFFLTEYARATGKPNPERYAKQAALRVTQAERGWQEIVQETKDLIVIKSLTVLLGNVNSNISLLILSGVDPVSMLRHHLTAWRGATSYQRDMAEIDRLQTLIDTNQTNGKFVEYGRQIVRLKDAVARNPVRTLIEEGLMPSIVEDVSEDDDIYSYKSKLQRYASKVTDKINPKVLDAAKVVYIGHDTTAYKTLRQITQLSDFMARYTQYQHLITRKKEPLSHAEAIQQASDDFINYDIPMHRGMQWLDDNGIFMFTKYFMRIQKVIARMVKTDPSKVLSTVLLGNYIDLGPIVLEGAWFHRVPANPLEWGALQYPGSLDELATIHYSMKLLK